jgi:hypothetical protein
VAGKTTIPGPDMADHAVDHGLLRLDPEARNAKRFRVDKIPSRRTWRVEQVLVDTEERNDWSVMSTVDLDRCDGETRVVAVLGDIKPVGN